MAATDGVDETPTPLAFSSLSDLDAWLTTYGLKLVEPSKQEQAWLEGRRELTRQICAMFGIETPADAQERS